MTDKSTPTDAELKAMWQLHAADIGGIFYYARAVLAKWGQPVVAGEPYAYAAYFHDQPCEELVHDLDDLTEDLTNREHTITELYTTPQPTQTQAGAAPLTSDQVKAILVESGYYNADAQHKSHFMNGIRHGEAAHGIKHGANHDR